MKICPNCRFSYSDETLNFCLTDGTPLVKADRGIASGKSPGENTIIDPQIYSSNLTRMGQPALPIQSIGGSNRKFLFLGLIGLAVLILEIFFFLQVRYNLHQSPLLFQGK